MYVTAVCNNHMMTDDGAVDGGTFITVTGTYFVLSNKVRCRWGQEIVDGTQLNANEIQCISPAHAVGNVRFAISNNAQDFTTQNIQYTYQGLPDMRTCLIVVDTSRVFSLVPNSGPSDGSTIVTVYGEAFVNAPQTTCLFNLAFAPSVTVLSSSQLLCESPPHASTIVALEISNNNQDYTSCLVPYEFYRV